MNLLFRQIVQTNQFDKLRSNPTMIDVVNFIQFSDQRLEVLGKCLLKQTNSNEKW